ncbi:phosphatase [Lithospermum erythrorhizon]|uniref:Phosphatase n=1 Tax=Lithospermum erythrorhizon TaxID=34254 RepID=A0AAV3QZ55_LITER
MMALSLSRFPSIYFIKSTPTNFSIKMSSLTTSLSISPKATNKKLPILLFDVMDTIVRDPFYHHIPNFFRMSMKELLDSKHPTAWIEFEKGLIDEMELTRKFFKDGRYFDIEGLKNCVQEGYSYIDGIEELLHDLQKNGYEIHAFTNYPIWYQMIEEKLKLSNYLSWTFCSCVIGKRKPEAEFYLEVQKRLGVEPANCVFIDDRLKNVEAAMEAGFSGIHFKNAETLGKELSLLGINLLKDE